MSACLTALPFLALLFLAAGMVTLWPLQLSIATVFLFAGPHNWMEFRYFVARMPVRWGRARLFYWTALGGVAILALSYILLYALGQSWYLSDHVWIVSTGLWNTATVLWVATLVHLRGRELGRDRSWSFAPGLALCAIVWLVPLHFSLALVYLHPLVALWFLERHLRRQRPDWLRGYHLCLAAIPFLVVLIWAQAASLPALSGSDALSWRIIQHAGGGILTGISSRPLVATHVFLESIHYGVWLLLIPVATRIGSPWQTKRIPLVSRAGGRPRLIRAVLAAGVLLVACLWIAFAANYAATRDVYFTLAIAHVLAEAPFLIRA